MYCLEKKKMYCLAVVSKFSHSLNTFCVLAPLFLVVKKSIYYRLHYIV